MEETHVNNTNTNSGMSPTVWVVVIVLLVLVGGAFMFMNKQTPKQATSSSTTESITATSPTVMPTQVESTTPSPSEKVTGTMTDVKTIEMEAGSFYYNPKSITVKKGQKVVINLKAVDMMHNINIDELNVHSKTVSSGSTITVEFVADKIGTYEYYCAVGQHRQKGQVGTLIVQ